MRLLSELLANGDADERACADPSPLFLGGLENRVHSIVALVSPLNGTTAYDLFRDPSFDPDAVIVPPWSKVLAKMMSAGTAPKLDGRAESDYANFDMQIDRALALNARIATLPSVFYFSVPCAATVCREDGTHAPKREMEPLFVMRSYQIGAYKGTTVGGLPIDESWRENDGLVNTLSAMSPAGAPSRPLDRKDIRPGIWNICPTVDGDHMWLQGGLTRKHDVREFYLDLLKMNENTLS